MGTVWQLHQWLLYGITINANPFHYFCALKILVNFLADRLIDYHAAE